MWVSMALLLFYIQALSVEVLIFRGALLSHGTGVCALRPLCHNAPLGPLLFFIHALSVEVQLF